ncbi:MAG: NAD(P)-dependent oxidoreductase [Nitrosomonas sp.]|nr:NAD(P)-dependent oxidoreductase [Nitrosomonas sp.]MBP6076064.1 NAD(P)-dependent oxidoreductase [Nitrosomonas sp.]
MNEKHAGLLGATSLVGECLLKQFIQNHWHVTAFSRRPFTQIHPQITWQQLDTINPTKIDTEKKIPFWLCVAPIWVVSEYFDLLLAYGVRRIVVLSSTSRFTKNASFDCNERKIASQLIKGEELVQTWATSHGIEWIILRSTLIYGYGRDKNITEIAQFIRRFGFFPVFGSAHGLRQPIHVEDVASACFYALSTLNLTDRPYNLTGGETLPYREMVKRVFEALDRKSRLLTVPLWFFRMTTWGLRWLPRYQHWTAAMAERMNQDLIFDSSDTKRDLNFSPRSFKLTTADLPSQNC